MDRYNEHKEEIRGRPRDQAGYCPLYPERESPRPHPFRCAGRADLYGRIEDDFDLQVYDMDKTKVIMIPSCYEGEFCRVADTFWYESPCAERCVKTCFAYEYIGEHHPRLARYAGREPWTALPLLERPSGPPLCNFLGEHYDTIYFEHGDTEVCRPRPEYLPLMYQWTLQALSAISFSHSRGIIVGYFEMGNFWLSSDLSLSFIGFVSASFNNGKEQYENDIQGRPPFNPFHGLEEDISGNFQTTVATDLFVYATFLHLLLTGGWPEGDGGDAEEMIANRQWPRLEKQYFGEILVKCWEFQYKDAQELKADIVHVLRSEGWEVEGEDTLKSFDASTLPERHFRA
ncbi:hypothetical protein NM208_g16063 [Fusarium decemcellulare]|uniref:Uncharacterized protein n=1 Tax=Fusarium decemcellulare TaxID=57161 RepID=A0ACC1REL7_9HYPO|nr:hypothetical protein NM208_g16063 [Fusarium decemcellulare]